VQREISTRGVHKVPSGAVNVTEVFESVGDHRRHASSLNLGHSTPNQFALLDACF
jgi:hypothetical protein